LREHVVVGIIVGFCVFEEDPKLAVQASLDGFAVVCQNAGLLLKITTFFCGINVLFEALYR
jgi:hypothetical protein